MGYTKRFEEILIHETALVGGKGASLGALHQRNIPVPSGFVVTTDAFRHFQAFNAVPEGLEDEILEHIEELHAPLFAVRSSATVEDSSAASWAGQFESFLHVAPGNVMDAVRSCWNSSRAARVEAYRRTHGVTKNDIALAVVIQTMVPSRVSGVCFTAHPVSGNSDEMLIEAVEGVAQSLVDGTTNPDRYLVKKMNSSIVEKIGQRLSDEQILMLCRLCQSIENHAQAPQDIEWAFDGTQIYIVQSRPITTM